MAATQTDRRVRRTRHALQDALFELIAEKRYESVTVQDILDRADVGRSTFYAHFHDKDELLLSGFERLEPMLDQHRDAALGGSGFIDDMPIGFLRHVAEQSEVFKALLGQRSGSLLQAHVADYLADYAREVMQARLGDRKPAVPLEVVARYATGSFLAMVVWWLDNDMPYPPEEFGAMLATLITPGVHVALDAQGERPRGSLA